MTIEYYIFCDGCDRPYEYCLCCLWCDAPPGEPHESWCPYAEEEPGDCTLSTQTMYCCGVDNESKNYWCVFYTLAAINCSSACNYASAYYAAHPELGITGCNGDVGVPDGQAISFMSQYISLTSIPATLCDVHEVLSNNKKVLCYSSNHVFLIYCMYSYDGTSATMYTFDPAKGGDFFDDMDSLPSGFDFYQVN